MGGNRLNGLIVRIIIGYENPSAARQSGHAPRRKPLADCPGNSRPQRVGRGGTAGDLLVRGSCQPASTCR